MLLKHWFLLFFTVLLLSSLSLNGMQVSRKLQLVLRWRGNKELVKWRGMSFRESQRGIVFNPWLCGSPGMPSLLLPPPQRQGIKDTLHLFLILYVCWDYFTVHIRREMSLCFLSACFFVSGLKSLDISAISKQRNYCKILLLRKENSYY